MYLVINAFYAYVFYFGGYLIWNEVENGVDSNGAAQLYNAGSVFAIMFSVVFGAF